MTEKVERILCRKCGIEKPIAAFTRWTKSAGNGRPYRLRTCTECHRIQATARHTAWREANRDHMRSYSRTSRKRWLASLTPDKKQVVNDKLAKRARERRDNLKAAVYLAYGGAVCACCGETEPLFLSIDHVNNDGYEHRKQHGWARAGGEQLMRWIANNGFPKDYQILCMNCNHGKSRNGGICPHELEKVQRLGRKPVEPSGSKPPALIA